MHFMASRRRARSLARDSGAATDGASLVPRNDRPYVLKGERIGFRTLRREDIPLFTKWFQNLEMVLCLTSRGLPQTIENETEWYDQNAKVTEKSIQFGIYQLKGDRHIGNCGLFNIAPHNCATLGIAIGEPDAWGKGYGTEATRLLAEYAMFFLDLHNVRLNVFSFNERARRAYLRAGFREVGRVRGTIMVGGKRYDEVVMDITRDEVDLSRMRKLVPLLDECGPLK
jgi:RimJ/RimL family protein N-acetyltransferase